MLRIGASEIWKTHTYHPIRDCVLPFPESENYNMQI